MIKNNKQLTIVVDKKQDAFGMHLLGKISEKGYIANKLTPNKFEENALLTSKNKVIFLGPSKLYNDVREYSEPKYSKYGMEYGWLGNNCFIGVDSKKFKLEDKKEIVEQFPERVKKKVKEQEDSKRKKKSIFKRSATVFPRISYIDTLIWGYYAFKKASEYKNKTDLQKDMWIALIQNFVNDGLDEFMEKD